MRIVSFPSFGPGLMPLPLECLRRLLTLFAVPRVTPEFVAAGRPFAGLSDSAAVQWSRPLSPLHSPLPRMRLAHLDGRVLGDEFLGNERDPHAPSGMHAEQPAELPERQLLVVDMDGDFPVRAGVVDDAAEHVAAGLSGRRHAWLYGGVERALFNWRAADALVAFAKANGQRVRATPSCGIRNCRLGAHQWRV